MKSVDKQVEHHQHGSKGMYFGGNWVDIEDMDKHCVNHSKDSNCSTCPRSSSRHSSAKEDGSYDVIVIGAGCIGGAIARELSKTTASVLLLEAADDVTQGATKGNSGIVHAGFDDAPGSVRAKFCWPGNQMFAALDDDLHFGYQKNGSLVLAFSEDDMLHLEELKKRGETNGVERLRIIHKDELFRLEPHVNPSALGALLSPDAGNVIPYEYAIALVENAVDNNVELRIRREVTSIEKDNMTNLFTVTANHWEPKAYVDYNNSKKKKDSENMGKTIPNDTHNADATHQTKNPPSNSSFAHLSLPMIGAVLSVVGGLLKYNIIVVQGGLEVQLLVGALLAAVILFGLSIVLSSHNNNGKHNAVVAPKTTTTTAGAKPVGCPAPVGSGGDKITVEEMLVGGSGSRTAMNGVVIGMETFRARFIVNCAGGYSDKIAHMIGDNSFKIKPRLGDYLLLHKNQGHLASHTLFPCPGKLGKGVLVQTTLWGNLILGPTARDTYLEDCMTMTNEQVQEFILSKCKQLVPSFDASMVIHAFCGARAKSTRNDWIIEPSEQDAQFIHAAGIDSPGLAGSPAIAIEVLSLLQKAGLRVEPNRQFNPKRNPIVVPKNGWNGIRAGPIGKYTDPKQNVVCKCEKVTEAEIVDAIHRSLPVDSTQAIRKRTRAGMGDCQANPENYDCESRVRAIIARELACDPLNAVGGRPWPATSTLPQRWIDDQQKAKLVELQAS